MALLVTQECPTYFRRSEQRREIVQLRREDYRQFPLMACNLYFWFCKTPLLLCLLFSAHLDINDHTSGQIVSGLDVICALVNLSSTREEPWCGRLFRMRNLVDPLQLSLRILFPTLSQKQSMLLSSRLSKLVFVCLTTSVYSNRIGNEDSFGKYKCSLGMTCCR